ncbi:2-dehydro-3-deoxy-6-phosphogalactonate aldolase [Vibrio sp. VB16]|uniref:2-dehydro-3-deoxy-6-phosphogalactonate aldolase n=1 Tax=Vibrio sp. VB16 TaxID=2785746 RepID=UPI00189C7BC1|nr:2-dehydro-3-deoxy-6-phosphogalactonate aldolase [Vibrio sp. VB16]UGA53901.1 2-dehydro-3-deoxy-6-phosphogalactonate aldolase [Vibrio sp. VB16]
MNKCKATINGALPLIAILRGILPKDAIRITRILIDEGFSFIEVPLNSPQALKSIQKLVDCFGSEYFIGAGTVTTAEKAEAVISTGANLVVTPNLNEQVIRLANEANCAVFPGVATPSEAFSAIALGVTGIKLFPISVMGLEGFKALKAVLPEDTLCLPVGGINPKVESMKPFLDSGAYGFGLGGALYTPSMSDEEVKMNANAFIKAYHASLEMKDGSSM